MNNILGRALKIIVSLYLMSLLAMTPYYNWQYAKQHGFIKWLFLGEIVATLKSTAWPYFAFFSESYSQTSSADERHYVNSKKACDEAMKIIVNSGDVSCLSYEGKVKVADLLGLAITEANQIKSDYLQKVHPAFPEMFDKNYKYALSLIIEGLRNDNTKLVLTGAYGYNEYADWMKAHAMDLSF
ncbi:MAG: hypothetical protein ABIK28_11980 [Planctomycetota bacterium]